MCGFYFYKSEKHILTAQPFCKYGGSCASYGCCACEGYSNTSMLGGMILPTARKKRCEAELKGCVRVLLLQIWKTSISQHNLFCKYGGSYASCGCCADEEYDTTSMGRGVGVAWAGKKRCEAELKGCVWVLLLQIWKTAFHNSTIFASMVAAVHPVAAAPVKSMTLLAW